MLHHATIETLSETLPDGVKVKAQKRNGVGRPAQFIAATAATMKRPWVVFVNDVLLMDDRSRDLRYATEAAAVKAGQQYAKAIVDTTFGYYWEKVHTKSGTVVNSGLTIGFGNDRVGTQPDAKVNGFEMRTIAI